MYSSSRGLHVCSSVEASPEAGSRVGVELNACPVRGKQLGAYDVTDHRRTTTTFLLERRLLF